MELTSGWETGVTSTSSSSMIDLSKSLKIELEIIVFEVVRAEKPLLQVSRP
jgi:hypothetical protein